MIFPHSRTGTTRPRRGTARGGGLLALRCVAALAAVAAAVTACSTSTSGQASPGGRVSSPSVTDPSSSSGSTAPSTGPSSSSAAALPTKPVHVSLEMSDGAQVGVGMPIIAYLSRPITDAKAFAAATKVTVNGDVVHGAWYFETKYGLPGKPIEADYRLAGYWPGHASIHMDLPVKGLSAGTAKGDQLRFDDDLTLSFTTGKANILTVSNATHQLTVKSDGTLWGTFPVSLGAPDTPTRRGTKVIMEKGLSICMSGPGYHECDIKDTQRLTYDGEYLHAAPWNVANIEHGVNSSNGCTNLLPADAEKLYNFLEVGDVVQYPDATGPHMTLGEGYGDWNLTWSQWQLGGLYQTS